MYNEDYVNDFEESEYIRYLRSPSLLGNLAKAYLNRYNSGININLLALKESLDHYVVKRLTRDSRFLESAEFDNYIKIYNYYL